jgi:hypothetical protein
MDKIEALFYHIREIMMFNKELLSRLEQRVHRWHVDRTLGDIFLEYVSASEITHEINI